MLDDWRHVGVVGIILSALLAGCRPPSQPWESYQSTDGGFSILMPGIPTEEEEPLTLPGGASVPLKTAKLEHFGIVYFTGYVDYPKGVASNPAINIQDLLSASINGATQSKLVDSKLTQADTLVNGVPCRQFETSGQLNGRDARMEGVFCLKGDRLFEVLVIGKDQPEFTESAQKFISSLAIQGS